MNAGKTGRVESIDSNNLSNEAWLAGLRTEDPATVRALRDRLCNGLKSALGRRADAGVSDLEDFAQEAVLRVLRRLDQFRGEAKFTTWAMALAVRLSLTELRKRKWNSVPLDVDAQQDSVSDGSVDASLPEGRREMFDVLRRGIDEALTDRQRKIITSELNGVPQVVLAQQLSIAPNAVYKVSHDARKKLRAYLDQSGFDRATVAELLDRR